MSLILLHNNAKHLFGPLIGEKTTPKGGAANPVKAPVKAVKAVKAPKAEFKYTTLSDEFLPIGTHVELMLVKPIVVPVDLPEVYIDYVAIMMATNPKLKITRDDIIHTAHITGNTTVAQFNYFYPKRLKRCERIIKDSMK